MNLTQAKALAQCFHEAYERLAPKFGYQTREDTRSFDPESPNGKLMTAVCAEVYDSLKAEGLGECNETLSPLLTKAVEALEVFSKCSSHQTQSCPCWITARKALGELAQAGEGS